MKQRIVSVTVAGFLLLCIVLGGSAQSPWTNLGLQVAGVLLLAWAAIAPVTKQGRMAGANLILLCGLLLVLVQLIPLPPSLWTKLPGREPLASGLTMLGYPLRPATISESPYQSVLALFAAIPAIAAFAATRRLGPSPRLIALAVVAGLVAAVLLGALQVAGGPQSWAYFYPIHSPRAIGFFANGNHMAALLLVGIPMAAALAVSVKSNRRMSAVTKYAVAGGVFGLVIVGIVLNGSRAALGLSVPVIVASIALFPGAVRWRGPALAVSALAFVAGIGLVMANPINAAELSLDSKAPGAGRGEIWRTTADAVSDNFPVGTGLGTFQSVYHRYEQPDGVTRSYVNHAHNDYLELALELGAGGILLIVAFLVWWGVAAVRIWMSPYSNAFARASTIATATVLAHSIVDFPLRTAAISSIFGACIALMAQHFATAAPTDDGRATRHVRL